MSGNFRYPSPQMMQHQQQNPQANFPQQGIVQQPNQQSMLQQNPQGMMPQPNPQQGMVPQPNLQQSMMPQPNLQQGMMSQPNPQQSMMPQQNPQQGMMPQSNPQGMMPQPNPQQSMIQQQNPMQNMQNLLPNAPHPNAPAQITIKEMNVAYLCKLGADFVESILTRTLELFQLLRSMNPQIGSQQSEERKNKIAETMKTIDADFKRLRKIYERCSEVCSTMDFVSTESFISIKDEDDDSETNDKRSDIETKANSQESSPEKKKKNPKMQLLEKEYQDLNELCQLKNRQIKEIIDRLRKMVWDINTMLAMEN